MDKDKANGSTNPSDSNADTSKTKDSNKDASESQSHKRPERPKSPFDLTSARKTQKYENLL